MRQYQIIGTGEIVTHDVLVDWICDCAGRTLTDEEIELVIARLIEVGEYRRIVQ